MIVDYYELAHNENPALTGAIIANAGKIKPKYLINNNNSELAVLLKDAKLDDFDLQCCTNPGMIERVIELLNRPDKICVPCNSGITDYTIQRIKKDESFIFRIANNPDPKLTKFIKDFAIKVIGYYNDKNYETFSWDKMNGFLTVLSSNTNPELAEVIMMCPVWWQVSHNSNYGLTKFIIEHESLIDITNLSGNTNPELAGLIIKNIRKASLNLIAKNPNPGLTEFIKKYINILDLEYLLQNTNPELAELIIANINKDNYSLVFSNSNPKLTKFILDAIANDHTASTTESANAIESTIKYDNVIKSTAQH